MRRVREDRQLLGSPTDVSDMWSHAVLRQLAESARQQTRGRQWTSGDRIGAAGRTLVVLLFGRRLYRILSGDYVPSWHLRYCRAA